MLQPLQRPNDINKRFQQEFAQRENDKLTEFLQGAQQKRQAFEAGEKENQTLKRLLGKDVSGLTPDMKKLYIQKYSKNPQTEQLKSTLMKSGATEEEADLYNLFTIGGQTVYAKELIDRIKRRGKANQFGQKSGAGSSEKIEISPEEQTEQNIQKTLAEQDEGLTSSEKVARGKERYTTGLKTYEEAGLKLRGMTRDKQNLELLEKFNEGDKLPKDIERLNVDSNGNLRAPFLASADAQRYVKTLNEFSTGAKDTFGARVTNFDLSQYLKRYPTLLNSKEGRKQLIQQMKIVNDINSVYYKNLKNVYDRAGGVRRIDADVAERIAEEISGPQIEKLVKKFDTIGQFASLPSPQEFKGKKIQNKETGEIMESDGTNWNPTKG